MRKLVLAAGLLIALPTIASAQNVENGKTVFKKCLACHAIGPDAKNKVGPVLNGIAGRKAGMIEGFNYSEAMKTSGKTWDDATLDAYLTNPKDFIPKNKMIFVGLKEEADRKDLIAYLKDAGK
jgi:cytochrome c